MDADDGLVKILVAPDGKILGAHILGAHASDLIHEVTVVMRQGGTIHDIAHTVHAHPSLSEILLALPKLDAFLTDFWRTIGQNDTSIR